MGVVSVSSSASRTPVGLFARFVTRRSSPRRPCFLAFKTDSDKNSGFVATKDCRAIPVDSCAKESQNRLKRSKKKPKKVKAVLVDEAPPSTEDLDYGTVAATLESIYKLSPDLLSDMEALDHSALRCLQGTNIVEVEDEKTNVDVDVGVDVTNVVRSGVKKSARLNLEKRIALKRKNGSKTGEDTGLGSVDRLLRDYSVSTDLVSMDWKKMKIPPVLTSSEHTWLFKLMQPMKAILEVKETLGVDLGAEPTDGDLAAALNMNVSETRRRVEIGRAARNKLIKHNLRLVLFVINKYYQDFASGSKFQDLCQAGVKGLIVAIDRFEQKRGFRLSTYSLFWIRHAIIRSMTVSSFTRVPFGIESIRQEIQKAKLNLMFELERLPDEEEIIARVGISNDRYHDIMKASKHVLSLHARHMITREEFIKGIKDVDGVGGDKRRQPALLRLALDDVLDSLKPKESMVIRQRYGLDGKGDRTLGEIAGNLNISREMVRKHEVKALMKLKHPARVDYLRRYIT